MFCSLCDLSLWPILCFLQSRVLSFPALTSLAAKGSQHVAQPHEEQQHIEKPEQQKIKSLGDHHSLSCSSFHESTIPASYLSFKFGPLVFSPPSLLCQTIFLRLVCLQASWFLWSIPSRGRNTSPSSNLPYFSTLPSAPVTISSFTGGRLLLWKESRFLLLHMSF